MSAASHPDTISIEAASAQRRIGLFLFDGVEELDAVGPWEVLADWTQAAIPRTGGDHVPVDRRRGRHRRQEPRLGAHHSIADAPALDVLIHPGGQGTRRLLRDPDHLDWVRAQKATPSPLMTSVCTGSLVYAAAGLLRRSPGTTHWASLNLLSELDPTIRTDVDARFVDDGDVITSAGVSAGIDMALHLVARLAGRRPRPRGAPGHPVRPATAGLSACPGELNQDRRRGVPGGDRG